MNKIFLLSFFTIFAFGSFYNSAMLENIAKTNVDKNKFSFVVMGDNRDGDDVFKKIIQKINKDDDISFVLNNGDFVANGYESEYEEYINIIKTSNKPILSIIGNHELPWYRFFKPKTNYKKVFGKTNFAFSYINSFFIIIDTSKKKLKKKHFKWLKKQLKISQKYKHRFVFTHTPLYDPRKGKYKKGKYKKGHSFKSLSKAKKLNDLLDKYNVDMIFCSHIHLYYKGVWQKTPFIITAGAGAPLRKYKEQGFYHYIKVVVDDDKVDYQVVRIK